MVGGIGKVLGRLTSAVVGVLKALGGERQVVAGIVVEAGRHGGGGRGGTGRGHPRSNMRVGTGGGRVMLYLGNAGGLENGELTAVIGKVAHATVVGCDIGTAADGEGEGSRGDLRLILGGGPSDARSRELKWKKNKGAGGGRDGTSMDKE